ncbi:MAG: endo-1,4-beta-xylanase, partial [Lachnospiraceae bacterium]|nr:endo-1,4-beta-xylanase [Lachnospiraceae bacterium]
MRRRKLTPVILIICLLTMIFTACASTPKVKLPAQKEVTDKTLKSVFEGHGMKIGTCISGNVINNKKMADLVAEQYNSLTMENAMKPDYI